MSEKGEREQSGVKKPVAEQGVGANAFGTKRGRWGRGGARRGNECVWNPILPNSVCRKARRFRGLKLLCVGRSEKRSVGQQPYVNVATDVVNVL